MTKSAKGNSLVNVGGYRFSLKKNRPKGPKQRWRCSSHHKKVSQYIVIRRGRQMLNIKGYLYGLQYNTGPKRIWRCTSHYYKGCLASVHTYNDDIILRRHEHTH
ncbi:unnamed protein product, partial [Iphiclides podalirius]